MTQITIEVLTVAEQEERDLLEHQIDAGLDGFLVVTQALLTIRNKRLWRSTHSSFEAYCSDRWVKIGRSYAYELANAGEVIQNLSGIPDSLLPANPAQVRPLTKLEPEEQREAWQEAIASTDSIPTASQVKDVVERRLSNRKPTFETGEEVKVTSPSSKYYSQPAKVVEVDRDFVVAEMPDGEVWHFLNNEIEPAQPKPAPETSKPKPAPKPTIEQWRSLLARIVEAVELPADLLAEAQEMLG